MRIREYLGDRAFYRNTAVIAIPIALQSLITIGVNLIDNIMLGSLGEIPLSASALAVQFIGFYNICSMGLGMGASVLVSRFWGMKDIESLRKTITLMLRFTILIGVIFTLSAVVAPSEIMHMYSGEKAVVEQGIVYLRWSIPCFLLMGLSTTCTICRYRLDILQAFIFIFRHSGYISSSR